MHSYFVRLGSLAEVYRADANVRLPRGRRVVVRTARGVELGVITAECKNDRGQAAPGHHDLSNVDLSHAERGPANRAPAQASEGELTPRATILRPTTEEDELLIRRLDRHKREAVEACRKALVDAGSQAVLLDVDHLFDGNTLLMHFLGEVDELAEKVTREIADRYESIVRTRHLAKLLSDGCGPACGTGESGCGGNCTGCSVAAACSPSKTTSS